MRIFDEIKQYLPTYLSDTATQNLFQNLEDFPDNIHDKLYSLALVEEDDVFQGDGLRKMPSVELPSRDFKDGPVIVISNTCDTSFSNTRFSSPYIIYCPIIKLSKYAQILEEEGISAARIGNRIEQIRKQHVSNIFYLPDGGQLPEECIAMLDRINSCDSSYLTPEIVKEKRLFSLSDYGFYMFLFKLSIHFTRIRENVQRG